MTGEELKALVRERRSALQHAASAYERAAERWVEARQSFTADENVPYAKLHEAANALDRAALAYAAALLVRVTGGDDEQGDDIVLGADT